MSVIIDAAEGKPALLPWIFALFASFIVTVIVAPAVFAAFSAEGRFWKSQQWAGTKNGLFAGLRAQYATIASIRDIAQSGYEKHSKHGRSFAVPLFNSAPWIVLPPSTAKELVNKADDEVNADVIHYEQVQVDYTQGKIGRYITENSYQFDIVRRQLTRKLPLLTADIYDELKIGFEEYWAGHEWTTVKCFPTCTKIVTRAANRVFGGSVLCRNEKFLDHSRLYSQGVFGGAALINMVPKFLRPIAAPIIMWHNRRNETICKAICVPIIQDRLEHTQQKRLDPEYDWQAPVDALQWLIEHVLDLNDPKEIDPNLIALRLMNLNMVAIHTTSMTTTNVILDIYSSPHADEFVEGLREECSRVLEKYGGEWSKAAINELIRVDSAIRESMRFSDLGWLALNRMVTAPQGVTFSNNIHVPHGIQICLPASSIHKDENFYPNPYEYNAFRFSAPREEYEASTRARRSSDTESQSSGEVIADLEAIDGRRSHSKNMLDLKNTSLVTTTDDFYSFGHGRHACPGRFFAAQEMKLMLAYLVMNYDVEKLPQRPVNQSMVGLSFPSNDVEIRIRQRPQLVTQV